VQELARSWGCRAQGNGPEPRQHWRSGQKKSQPDKGWDFKLWWSRRESNPRPQVLYSKIYILIPVIWF